MLRDEAVDAANSHSRSRDCGAPALLAPPAMRAHASATDDLERELEELEGDDEAVLAASCEAQLGEELLQARGCT